MSRKPDHTLAAMRRTIADLQHELAVRTAERDEGEAQKAGMAEVLQVVNSSPGDLARVFKAMLERAMRLCEAKFGLLTIYDGVAFHAAALHGVPAAFAEAWREPRRPGPGLALYRLTQGEHVVHIPDVSAEAAYQSGDPIRRALVDLGGARTGLWVALRKNGALLGAFVIYRQEVRPFTDNQIALLQNFAAQAVIAMENARLLTETREALDQQTATAEVLQVINSSPGDLTPVFEAMLEKALNLCSAAFGVLWTYHDEFTHAAAIRGATAAYREFLSAPHRPGPGSAQLRLIRGERFVHVADLADSDDYRSGDALPRALVDLGGGRSLLAVPLRKDGAYVGAIMIYRQQPSPFSDKQIALLENFAAQAVIAMENARLLIETRESLEFQTATSDVLQVISQSTFDLQPVLENVIDTALRLCRAHMGSIFRLAEDGTYRWAVGRGLELAYEEIERTTPILPNPGTLVGRVAADGVVVQIADAEADPLYAVKDEARLARARTMLGVPLLREGVPIGVIAMARDRVEPFSDKEVALVSTFADQAVIAIENVRLLTETREALEQQTATAEVLGVINASPGDLAPVFDAMLEKALALCEAAFGTLRIYDGEHFHPAAMRGLPPAYDTYLATTSDQPGPESPSRRVVRGESIVHVIDLTEEERYRSGHPYSRALVDLGGARTVVVVALRKDGVLLGTITIYRQEVRPFTDKQIALLQNFAAQAVIAMENARLISETREARDNAETALRDLKAVQQQLVVQQKMAALGQLTAGIAHEIKNPLNFVNNFAGLSVELLEELKETAAPGIATLDADTRAEIDETVEMLTSNLEKITEHGRRADGIVKSMLEHSRGGSDDRRSINLNTLIDEALNLAYHGARAQDQNFNIALERDFAAGMAPVELVPQDITRVFLNLFGNGFYAANQRRKRTADKDFFPTLKVATRGIDGMVEIRVRDNGTGIAPEIRDKLFQPFVTTKPTGEGTGLGLSISYDIVTQQHRGSIEVDSAVDEFTEFTIRLPRR